jgi:hypothetical protein
MTFQTPSNVEFKIIAGQKSGNREYAISSDGIVWIGSGKNGISLTLFKYRQKVNGQLRCNMVDHWRAQIVCGNPPE